MNIKKLFVGVAVVALALTASVSFAGAQTTDITALLAQIAQLQAQISGLTGGTAGATASVTFTRDLTIGSSGADVTALQNWLISQGQSIPAGATGYFGAQTKAALAAYQAKAGISPAAGYFGAKTRAAIAALVPSSGGSLPAGCTSTSGYSSTTGKACNTGGTATNLPAGCTSTVGYSVSTGVSCSTPAGTNGSVGVPSEGSITTKLSATPAQNANVRQQTDVPVYGIDVSAVNSDMVVSRFDMQVAVTPSGGSAQNPASFINTIKAWDGTTLLGSWSVGTADFVKDTSDRYHIILTGLNFRVPKATTKSLTFSFSVAPINTADVNRTVAIQGYAGSSQNVRATDTVGLQSYSDMSGTANTLTHTFKPAGASTLTVSLNQTLTGNKGDNNRVSSTNGVAKKVLMGFDAKSESGASIITKIFVKANASSTAGLPSVLYLCDGADTTCASPLKNASGPSSAGEVGFTNLTIPVAQDTTKSFIIAGDFPTTAGGQVASTSMVASSVQWQKPDGSTASTTPSGTLVGQDHYFYSAVPIWALNGTPTATPSTVTSNGLSTTTISFVIPMKVTASGGSLVKPVITSEAVRDFTVLIASSTQSSYTVGANAEILLPGNSTSTLTLDNLQPTGTDPMSDGGTYTFNLLGTLIAKNATGVVNQQNGQYFMIVTAASSTVAGNRINQTWGLADFRTPSATLAQ